MSVTISELKNRLSHYLRKVRRGETVLVRDRDRVIARIEPAGTALPVTDEDAAWLAELEERGTIRPARKRLRRDWLARRPRMKADLVGALLEEREEGR